jgi:hypothetical protein
MLRTLLSSEAVPTMVQERLTVWGQCIRARRLSQRLPVIDFCERLGCRREPCVDSSRATRASRQARTWPP